MPAKKTKKIKFAHDSYPKATISATCTWDEMSMTWIPKKVADYSASLQLFVRLAKGKATDEEVANTTVKIKGRGQQPPTADKLKEYKKLPVSKKNGNKGVALHFDKKGTPTISQIQRAIHGTEFINEAVRKLYWLSASQLSKLIKMHNAEMEKTFKVPALFLLKLRPYKKPPKTTGSDDIAMYLIQKSGDDGATRDWEKVDGITPELLKSLVAAQATLKKRADSRTKN